jgi:uncharacterized protein (TIGR04255 family)
VGGADSTALDGSPEPPLDPLAGYRFWLSFRYRRLVPTTRRRYLHAPLAYVILQVTHPVASPISRGEEEAIKRALRAHAPLASREVMSQLEITGQLNGAAAPQTRVSNEELLRFTSRDKRMSVTYAPNALSLETTRYETWEQLREVAEIALQARMDVAPVDGVERIGLRYLDEVRIPGVAEPDWREWVDPQLAPPMLEVSPGVLRPHQQQSVVQYKTRAPQVVVALRYGAVDGPSAVQGVQLAVPSVPPSGPFFLIDTDASWTPGPGEEVPPLDTASVITTADDLHGFVKELFEASLTDRLREEVLDAP